MLLTIINKLNVTMPDIPNNHALAMLVLTVVALYFFRREDIPLETSSLAVLVVLCMIFTVFPFDINGQHLEPSSLFFGFGHEALVTVCALMIIGHALVRTGALVPVGRNLAKLWKISPAISLLVTLIIAGALSAFVNNTPIVVLLLPILTSVALRTKTDTSPMLLPMGLATLVGGMTTTIGTSTNLLVVSVASDMGLPRIGMFDFSLPAIIAACIAIAYLWLIAPKLLPQRKASLPDTSPRLFSAYLNINEDSVANGKTVAELLKLTDDQMSIESIQRSPEYRNIRPFPDTVIKEGDRLHVKDHPEQLKEFESVLQATLFSGAHKVDDDHPLKAEKQKLVEMVVIQASNLVGRTLKDVQFAKRYGISVLALHRNGSAMDIGRKSIGNVIIHAGDVLLVQGDADQVAELKSSQGFLIIDGASDLPYSQKAPIALFVLFLVVAVAAIGVLPIAISSLCGILVLLMTKCIDWSEVSSALSTQVILIVVASLALGSAMMQTGGADYIAQVFVAFAVDLPPWGIIASLMLMLAIMTNIVSNNAAAVIGTPIAISVANQLSLPVEPFILAVLFGANLSYATPMAYKTNLLVMNAGGYQFSDFIRAGVPLIILMWVSLSFLLSWIYF
ncbi:SLC13 family permease [Thalassotalea sp. 1_MG-2023]|uniref:SLC13 family permease n=1 Tax=Thalassotalea sp. 1_MG-2023 TaxID=3062680 RepID=UPI0026E469CF|nr:SLC13 family permease [Thalassotalea sp. 1_MG-2023]MDO6426061.1 SLC13 family permease [Thalassotalea sp. 1_MG-2023]